MAFKRIQLFINSSFFEFSSLSFCIDIHSSQWEFTNLGGPHVSKCAPDMWIFCCKASYASVRGNEYKVNVFTLQVLLPGLKKLLTAW